MPVNLASKFSSKVAERFSISSITDAHAGHDYSFAGVKTVSIYSIDTVPLANYTRSGTARYGSLTELGDTVQELTMTQDKGFTFSVDAGNNSEQLNIKGANKALKREIDEVITPHIDKYRFAAWTAGAGNTEIVTPTKANIIELIMAGTNVLDDALVPSAGRTLFIAAKFYTLLKLNPDFIGIDKLGEKALAKGVVGEIDGMKVVKVPGSWFTDDQAFIIKYRNSTVDPFKLKNYRIHKSPMGVDGNVVEGRLLFDSFVLETKRNGIYVATTA